MPQAAPALFALAAVQAVSQIQQGYAQKEESKYNATVKEGQANMIDLQGQIQQGQYDREKAQFLSKSTAQIGAAGIAPQGSAAAVMLNAQTQIGIDQAIAKFNNNQAKNYTLQEAGAFRRQGKAAVYSGYSNAFSTMMQAGSSFAMSSIGTPRNTTFDSVKRSY